MFDPYQYPSLENWLWQHTPLIVAGTSPLIYIDLGNDEPGMILQRREEREWVDYKVDGKVVKSPVEATNSFNPALYPPIGR